MAVARIGDSLSPCSGVRADLHPVLQVAFQGDDDHLHSFRVGEKRYGSPRVRGGRLGPPVQPEEGTISRSARPRARATGGCTTKGTVDAFCYARPDVLAQPPATRSPPARVDETRCPAVCLASPAVRIDG